MTKLGQPARRQRDRGLLCLCALAAALHAAPRSAQGADFYRFAKGSRGGKRPGDRIRPYFSGGAAAQSANTQRVEQYLEEARLRYAPDKPSRLTSVFAGIDTHTWEKTFGRVRDNTRPEDTPVLMRVAPVSGAKVSTHDARYYELLNAVVNQAASAGGGEARGLARKARRLAKAYWTRPATGRGARRDAVPEALLDGGAVFVEQLPFAPKPDSHFLDQVGPKQLRFAPSNTPATAAELAVRVDALAAELLAQRDATNARRRKPQPTWEYVRSAGLQLRGFEKSPRDKRAQAVIVHAAPYTAKLTLQSGAAGREPLLSLELMNSAQWKSALCYATLSLSPDGVTTVYSGDPRICKRMLGDAQRRDVLRGALEDLRLPAHTPQRTVKLVQEALDIFAAAPLSFSR